MRKTMSITSTFILLTFVLTQWAVAQVPKFEYETTFQHIRAVRALVFSPDGSLLATAEGPPPPNTGFPDLNVWSTVTHKRVLRISNLLHRRSITAVEFSPDSRLLASASADGNIGAWDPRTGQMLWYIENAHEGGVQSLSFSADSRLLVTGGRDNTVRLWNVESQRLLNTLEGHTDWVLEVAISRDNLIASASRDQTIRLWNLRGEYLGSLQGHTDFVTSVGFAPTGEIVSASRDMTIRSWNAHTGAPLRTFSGHTDHVHQVAVHAGMIASPSADGTVRLWALQGGVEFQRLEHTDVVRIAAFAPNALMLASGDERGNVVLYRDTPRRPPTVTPPTLRPAKLTVPHSIELVEDNRVVERGDFYDATFLVRNAEGTPLPGVEVKLSLGQWVFGLVRTMEIPFPPRLWGIAPRVDIDFLSDDDPNPPGEKSVLGWRVQSDPSPSLATTDSNGKAVFNRRLFSEGKYGIAATVLQNGREFLMTSFSTTSTPNKEYIAFQDEWRIVPFYRVPGGWKVTNEDWEEGTRNWKIADRGWSSFRGGRPIEPKNAPAYRVKVIPHLSTTCGVDLVDASIGVRPSEKYPGVLGLTSQDIKFSDEEWIDPKWTHADTVANESRDILILTVVFLNGSIDEHMAVEKAAVGWSDHANVKFDFRTGKPGDPSDIRIKFHYDSGKIWGNSLIGRTPFVFPFIYQNGENPKKIARRFDVSEKFAKQLFEFLFEKTTGSLFSLPHVAVSADFDVHGTKPTMNYFNLNKLIKRDEEYEFNDAPGLILHEFGHALGFKHEQVNPDLFTENPERQKELFGKVGKFEWNEEQIKKDKYGDLSPEEQQEAFNTNFGELSIAHTIFRQFDDKSIMLYEIRPEWNTVGYSTSSSNELSGTDTAHVAKLYRSPQPVIKLEGKAAIKGEIYEYTSNWFEKHILNKDEWEPEDINFSMPVRVFVGSGNSAVRISRKMHDDFKRTFNLYLGAARATSEKNPTDISIAIGAGFLNFDVHARAKETGFYGFTACDRIAFKLENPGGESADTSHPLDTTAVNNRGDVAGFIEIPGEFIKGATHIQYLPPGWVPYVARVCELDEHISLKISPDNVRSTYNGAADNVKGTLTLKATHFKPVDKENGFKLDSGTAFAAPSVALTVPDPTLPQITTLLPNYPNPFNPETWIPYHLAKPADVALTIYAIDGKVVRHLDLGHQDAGFYRDRARAAYWDGRNNVGERVASGIYFYTLIAGEFAATQKMLILK